jgi:hypothetical protein
MYRPKTAIGFCSLRTGVHSTNCIPGCTARNGPLHTGIPYRKLFLFLKLIPALFSKNTYRYGMFPNNDLAKWSIVKITSCTVLPIKVDCRCNSDWAYYTITRTFRPEAVDSNFAGHAVMGRTDILQVYNLLSEILKTEKLRKPKVFSRRSTPT